MSNFQRSRSKVWWGDDPPNIGSPVARTSKWNSNDRDEPEDKDWEPQVPQWIGSPDQQANVSNENKSPKGVSPGNLWPLRHGSPGSHKSQDSGFSDSDSSPPTSQYYPSPEIDNKDKSSSSSDSNNNENITVKQVIDFKETPKLSKKLTPTSVKKLSSDVTDSAIKTNATSNRMRSTSVIQTPYDLQKYMEVHNDEEHKQLLKDSTENIPKKEESQAKISLIPPENINSRVIEDLPTIKVITPKKTEADTKEIKVAKVKDLETCKTKSQDSLEFIQVSDVDHIAVNNLPRIRSPISNVPYFPEPDYDNDSSKMPCYSRSNSNQSRTSSDSEIKFHRDRLNKSLNYEAQRLDQQILDIQEGYHSLGYVQDTAEKLEHVELRPSGKFKYRNMTDSLQLKPQKKYGLKYKKSAPKNKDVTSSFIFFSAKKEKPPIVESHAGGILQGSRVPELGLPRTIEQDQWILVGYPENEKLVHHNEKLIGSKSETDLHSKLCVKATIPPPPQFQDKTESHFNGKLTHYNKREKLKGSTESFNINMECTSTPKMLAPHEYMFNLEATPQLLPGRNARRRVNLMEDVNNSKTSQKNQEHRTDETPLERVCSNRPDSVQHWLCDLVGSCENECMTTLQSKALGAEQKALVSSGSATITGNIKKVQTHGQIIVHQYNEVLRQLESSSDADEPLCLLVANVNEFVLTHSITLNTRPPGETPERWDRVRSSLQGYLQRLVEIGEDLKTEMNDSKADRLVLRRHLDAMLKIFEETTKAVLVQQLRTLVSIIEDPPSDLILKSTLTSVSQLAVTSGTKGHLHDRCRELMTSVTELPFVDCAVPRALLTAVIETNKNSVKALSLRALATICVNAEAVRQFEEAGGMEIIADMVSDGSLPEPAAREAATVLAQVTATWRRDSQRHDSDSLTRHMGTLVTGLTRILGKTECCQLLLLCTACLVNLVREIELDGAPLTPVELPPSSKDASGSRDPGLVDALTKNKTVERVLDAVKRRGPEVSVFLQEQTAALLNMLSRSPRCLRHLSSVPLASVALVCFTRVSPADNETRGERERGAHTRLLQHTVEAISRLCILPELSSQIVHLEGVPRLVRLVRMQRARQLPANNDDILVYALKALRTIDKHHPEAFANQGGDVKDMVEGHLMQSVMKFSAKQESYV